MNAVRGLTALVLAGTRPGGDPLAEAAGVSHKALLSIGGIAMLQRVLAALAAVPAVDRIVVAIDKPGVVESLPGCGKPVAVLHAGSGPSASVAQALKVEGTPLLVTTADHALLRPEWVEEFLAAGHGSDDVKLALARRESVEAAVPHSQRTWLCFADGHYSGCNLFLLRTPAAHAVVALWQQLEADRKRPLAMLRRLGWSYALRYRFGWLRLDQALMRLGRLSGATVGAVTLRDGLAAVDVDKPADLELVRQLIDRRARSCVSVRASTC
jgi:GTP:adenosylcobinamide-phosphate guanylyltransferase